jgi:hypothetical protein
MFDVIYDSPWHHPVLCWAATPLVLGLLWRARPRPGAAREAQLLWRLALFGQLLIALDALFTGSWSPLAAGTAASTGAGILFVILGDLRYFVLLERYSPGAPPSGPGGLGRSARGFLRALGLSLLVPILFAGVSQVLPAVFAEPRRKFLGYELLFLGLLLVVRLALLPRRLTQGGPDAAAVRRWLLRLTAFEAVQYVLWALADVVILAGERAGLLLRLLPNILYYLAFVPLSYLTAPPCLRGQRRAW